MRNNRSVLKQFLGGLLLMCLLSSCSSSTFNSEEELWEFLNNEDNGYLQSKNIQGVEYKLLYKPSDLLVKQSMGVNATQHQLDSLRNHYQNYVYFNVSMSRGQQELLNSTIGDRNKFGAMVNTLAFNMDQKIHAFTNKKDTIPLLDYIYPRMYGISKSTSMLFVYPKEEIIKGETISVAIEDLGFGTGEVSFNIPTELIENEPVLQL